MALMMLVGTSSAWADWYLAGSFNSWSTNNSNYKLSKNNDQEYFITGVQLSDGDEFKFVENNNNWKGWNEISNKNGGDLENANGNIKITESGTYDFYYTPSTGYLYTSYIVCTTCCDIIEIKHPWNKGVWTYKTLLCDNNNYSIEAKYGDNGCNWKINGGTEYWIEKSNLNIVGDPDPGDDCIFSFNTSNNTITITKVVTCNDITDVSSNFSLSETTYNYNGEPKRPTVSSTLDGIGDITTKYYNSEGEVVSEPTNAGTYTVKITVSQGATYCALTTETEVGTYTINKINQSDISIANNETTFCGFPANNQVTLNIDGGDGDGEVVYTSEDEDIATISDNNILNVKAEGTVTISAQKQVGTNHNASNTATKSFTFYKAPEAPTVESVTNLIKCGDNTSEGLITLKNYNEDYSYSISPDDEVGGDAQNGYQISIAKNYTITVTRKVNETCSLSTSSATIPVGLTDNTPAATVSITGENSICNGQSTTLTCNVSTTKGNVQSYQWNLNDTPIQGATEFTYKASETGNYTVVVTVSNDGCTDEFTNSTPFSLTVNSLPAAPSLISPDPVCEGTTVNLPTGYNWYDAETGGTEVQNTAISVTGTYWAAAVQNGCESAIRTRYDVTVNPKPTISISGKGTAVLYEDVTLTAEATDGAEVKWYLGDDVNPVATGTTYTITSENAGEVTVKAKAFLGGCESDFEEHEVTFSEEEDCTPIIRQEERDVEQTTKTKIICTTTRDAVYCYVWNGSTKPLGAWGAKESKMTEVGDGVFEIEFDNSGLTTFNMIFHNNSGKQTGDIENLAVNKVHKYSFEAGDNTGYSKADDYPITYTKKELVDVEYPPLITAPAVKTVSVNSEQGSGVVNFVGRVIKTGCAADADIWVGYQYKKANEEWPTIDITTGSDEKQLVPLGNNKGKVDFSINIEGLRDDDYHFRAYVINGYERSADPNNYDQGVYYGIDIPVTVSTKKYPIENLQIQYANDKGDVLQYQNVTYCVGDNAYIKLIYDGSKLKPEEDEINISSTLENTFTLVEGEADDLYTFVVKGNETITVNAKNKENTDNPTAELTINTYAVPVIPSIDIDKTTICSNDATGAKITVSNPQVDMTYQVYKILGESEPTTHGKPKTYSEGVLEFNSMTQAGTYYVRAYNEQCPKAIAQSLDEILTVIDADATSISISPETKTVNPWVPVTFTVSKEGNYDYTFSCKEIEGENDVTSNMVINKSGDTYVVKFPKPDGVSAATDLNGQVTFTDKEYIVEVKLNADVQCGTFDDESEVTLTNLIENCPQP